MIEEKQLIVIGKRIREARSVLNIGIEEMAKINGISPKEYLAHEAGTIDCSYTFLSRCAERLGVDIGTLISGETPRLTQYTLTRRGEGTPFKRRKGFEYWHLAARLEQRKIDPFVVKAPSQDENTPIGLSFHPGQEFNYVLSGRLKVRLNDKIEYLEPGDSILYDSAIPHGMIAVGGAQCVFLAVIIKGEVNTTNKPEAFAGTEDKLPAKRKLLYQRFMSEELDANGVLKKVKFNIPDNFNFAYDCLDVLAQQYPDRVALVFVDRERHARNFTFRQIADSSAAAANYLVSLGIKKGDRVMLILRRHYQFWILINALHRIGAVAIPAPVQLLAKDLEYRFNSVQIKCVISTAYGEVPQSVEDAQKTSPSLQLKIIVNGERSGWHSFDSEVVRYSNVFARPSDLRADDTALMFFSSGTTGYPKAVMHSMAYPLGHIVTARWWQNVKPGGLHFSIADTGWGKALWGKIYGQWLCESAVFVYDFDRFHADDILSLFKEYHITTFCAPPTMLRFFIKEDLSKYDLSSIEYATTAGEALNPEVYNRFAEATGIKFKEGFGQTETTLLICNLPGMPTHPGSLGKPSPQYDVEILNQDDKPASVGEVGEIAIRISEGRPCGLFQGYLNDEKQTALSCRDRYYHTGDTAWKDEEGYYWYVGRVDDLIKSSGYRIGPFEIESVIMELPYVLECAVIGVPDDIRGQVVKAFIVLTKDKTGTDELKKEIQDYVKKHTAPYKYPRRIEFIQTMPKTVNGKIRRTELKKMG